jgi:hypothetical protein
MEKPFQATNYMKPAGRAAGMYSWELTGFEPWLKISAI